MPTHSGSKAATKKLTDNQIKDAIHTVRVSKTGNKWTVKKIADPKIWRFASKEKALHQARELAERSSWTVVVHAPDGKIAQTLRPPGTSKRPASKSAMAGE